MLLFIQIFNKRYIINILQRALFMTNIYCINAIQKGKERVQRISTYIDITSNKRRKGNYYNRNNEWDDDQNGRGRKFDYICKKNTRLSFNMNTCRIIVVKRMLIRNIQLFNMLNYKNRCCEHIHRLHVCIGKLKYVNKDHDID